jgi:hypothetical protein
MKKLFFILYFLLLLIACISQKPESQEIKFINKAVASAKQAHKLLILEFTSHECVSCKMLNNDIFSNENYRQFLSENFVIVAISPSDSEYAALLKHFSLDNQSSVIYLDYNGNELDRTVNYDGDSEAYFNFIKDVSQGKNLYSVVFSAYKKDTLNIKNCFLMAEKLRFRNKPAEAIMEYRKVLSYDRNNKSGMGNECRLKIEKARMMQANGYDLETLGSQ